MCPIKTKQYGRDDEYNVFHFEMKLAWKRGGEWVEAKKDVLSSRNL
jgi:hypothetical protein